MAYFTTTIYMVMIVLTSILCQEGCQQITQPPNAIVVLDGSGNYIYDNIIMAAVSAAPNNSITKLYYIDPNKTRNLQRVCPNRRMENKHSSRRRRNGQNHNIKLWRWPRDVLHRGEWARIHAWRKTSLFETLLELRCNRQ
ncbi:PREDICTED: uncharacterized protein LOC109228153 [Nicotiana attenuata]|uniref:uncharacterized protein LOC109228153 n=1 Tax=Nicotiana attenuata TaxID=49451 RepID=UPI000905078F|nr:PREDICTED: uncharacterized protein LOC109228153 [Nicotiana attenuata]